MNTVRMLHPDPDAPVDRTPVQVGELWVNPVTKERVTILAAHSYLSRAKRATQTPAVAAALGEQTRCRSDKSGKSNDTSRSWERIEKCKL